MGATERLRENSRHKGGDKAVGIGHAGAHRDEREHVQVARQQRLPAAHEEGPAGPQYDRRSESELHVVRERLIDPIVCAGDVRAHFEHEDGDREHKADPEPACHVDKFGVWSGIAPRELRLERHPADWAGAGTDLPDLRMHRTCVDRAFGNGLRLARAEIFLRIVDEFRPAAG